MALSHILAAIDMISFSRSFRESLELGLNLPNSQLMPKISLKLFEIQTIMPLTSKH